WLAVKLAVTGLAAMAAAGLGSLVVSWWASPIDKAAHTCNFPVPMSSGPCAPSGPPEQTLSACLAEITRLGYRQQVTSQPSSRFWPFQWYETGIYTAVTLGLAGFCFWRIRPPLSCPPRAAQGTWNDHPPSRPGPTEPQPRRPRANRPGVV